LAVVRTGNVERALDALNFFLADVRDGLGPYLAIYLLTEQKWDEASIGIVMSVAAIAGIIAQTPAGALIDRSTAKCALMVTAAILVTLSCIALPLIHRFEMVAATQAIAAAAGAIFAPAVAAVTLGIVGPRAFARRTGRNEAFNHAGNAVAAAIAGATPIRSGPSWCSGCWPRWRLPASSPRSRSRQVRSTTMSHVVSTTRPNRVVHATTSHPASRCC
jgi:MFS family permease